MSKAQIVADAISAISAGQAQVLNDAIGAAVDAAGVEQKASDGTLTQADLDKAVADATAADAQALADAHAKADADLAALQVKLDAIITTEQSEKQVIVGLQNSVGQVQAALDAIKAIIIG